MAPKQRKQKQTKPKKESAPQHRPDSSVASLALHPAANFVAVAVHTDFRICALGIAASGDAVMHTATSPVRVVAFDRTGKRFLSAGDDKLVQIWDTETWKMILTIKSPKKVTAAVFSHDSSFVAFADKFGDVLTAEVQPEDQQAESVAAPLLGHLCSIVTSLAFSPDGKQLVSTDQDCKVRVSTMPKEPQKGAHSIQSICMGHSIFAKCCAFVCPKTAADPVLLSGGGDSTVRSWNHLTGKQLDCFTCASAGSCDDVTAAAAAAPVSALTGTSADGGVPPASALQQSDAAEHDLDDADDVGLDTAQTGQSDKTGQGKADPDESAMQSGSDSDTENLEAEEQVNGARKERVLEGTGQPAVLSLSTAPDGCTVAAAVEGRDDITILHCTPSGKLAQQQQLQLPGVSLPTQVQFDVQGRLWVVGGPLPGTSDALCIGVASCGGTGPGRQWGHDESVLPEEVKAALESRQAGDQSQASLHDAPASQQQSTQQLRKRVYSTEEREARKKNRNDAKS